MITTVAFYESINPGAAWVNLAAIGDQHIYTSGDDLTVPDLNQVVAVTAGVCTGGNVLARLVAPSLRDISLPIINPVNGVVDADCEPEVVPPYKDLTKNPLVLTPDEALNAQVHSSPTAAQAQWVIVWLADKAPTPANGEIVTIRGTNTDTLTADVWNNGNLTLDEELPVGRYALVGMRYIGAGAIAGRAVPRGGGYRPGCLGCDTADDLDIPLTRYGRMGVWCEFEHNRIPSIDFLSVSADSDQEVFLDLIKVG